MFLKFGLWTGLSTISLLAIDFIERLAINNFLDSQVLGFYLTVFAMFSYVYMPFQLISNIFLSFYLKDWKESSKSVVERIERNTIISIFVFLSASFMIYWFYDSIIINFYGVQYLGLHKDILVYFILVFVLKLIYSMTGTLSFISNNPIFLSISLFYSLIMSIILNYLLVPVYGIKGVLISAIITKSLLLSVLYWQYYKSGIKFSIKYFVLLILVLLTFLFFI